MLSCSLDVWPSSRSLADDMGIPIVLDFRPFDSDSTVPQIPAQRFLICAGCGAYVTGIYSKSDDKLICPFCGNISNIPGERDEVALPNNFKLDVHRKDGFFYLCFLLDLTAPPNDLAISKLYMAIALNSLMPETKFMVGFIEDESVSFIKVFNNGPKLVTFSTRSNLTDLISIPFLLNELSDVETVTTFLNEVSAPRRHDSLHTITDFSRLFSDLPPGMFIKYILISPNFVPPEMISKISLDVISPVNNGMHKPIDGNYIIFSQINEVELQIQTLIQRYSTAQLAVNVEITAFVPKQFEITPVTVKQPSARDGFSSTFTLSLPRSFGSIKDVAIEFVATYTIIDGLKGCTQRTLVMSSIYPVSKDPVVILRSVDPCVTWKQIIRDGDEEEFMEHLYEIYKTKVLEAMPGSIESDPFFSMFPNLQLLLRFLAAKKPVNDNLIVESEAVMVKHMPMSSFWATQNNKIEEGAVAPVWSHRAFKNIVCVVYDCGESIDIFMDGNVEEGSLLAQAIERKIRRRFPIPKVQKFQRSKFILKVQSEMEITDMARNLLEPKH